MIQEMIRKAARGEDLSEQEMQGTMARMLDGGASPSQIGALLTALRMKGETVDEIVGAARALRSKTHRFQLSNHLLNLDRDDINVETETILEVSGGERGGTQIFNVSAASTFVVAAAGIRVARFGNRPASRFLSTADVLEYMGINLEISSSDVERSIQEVGIGLMFAPVFHNPIKYVSQLREEMGIRTIFNLIGPLTNPAGAGTHVLGVYHSALTEKIARVIQRLEGKSALVFCGEETLDEMSLCGTTKISQLKDGGIQTFYVTPEDFGMTRVAPEALLGGNVRQNADIVKSILEGQKGPKRDLVILNVAAAFWGYGLDGSIQQGIERASQLIDSGAALNKFEALVRFTRQCVPFTLSAAV